MVVVLVGASGTGKTSIARAMAEKDGWVHAITTTTREPRKGSRMALTIISSAVRSLRQS